MYCRIVAAADTFVLLSEQGNHKRAFAKSESRNTRVKRGYKEELSVLLLIPSGAALGDAVGGAVGVAVGEDVGARDSSTQAHSSGNSLQKTR